MTAAVDEAFGQIMAALKEQGMYTNTLVIFSSDNGGPSWDNVSDNGILRGGKSDIYEGGFRLGAFVWWPGKIPAGGRIAEPLHVVDWYPTLAKLAGASVEQKLPLDGKDIWPVLTQGAKTPHEEILLMGSRPGQRAIRVGDWKLLVNPMEFRRPAKSSPVELFNLAKDPGEKHNLAAEQPERVKDMQARLQVLTANPANAKFLTLKETKAAKPNIIVFYTDDHGHADLGIQGVVKDIKTPHIDALARSGVLAKHGYSTAPQCVPSRAGLMVGKFQGRFNLDSNGGSLDGFDKETTIAARLQQAGYATAQFGKWHLGPTAQIPTHGFKHVFSQNAQSPFSANITLDGQDRPMGNLPPEMYHVDGCSRAAAALIERYKNDPFFLYVAYRAPHVPLDAPQKYLDRFPGRCPSAGVRPSP